MWLYMKMLAIETKQVDKSQILKSQKSACWNLTVSIYALGYFVYNFNYF
jgi:hypothetical protein